MPDFTGLAAAIVFGGHNKRKRRRARKRAQRRNLRTQQHIRNFHQAQREQRRIYRDDPPPQEPISVTTRTSDFTRWLINTSTVKFYLSFAVIFFFAMFALFAPGGDGWMVSVTVLTVAGIFYGHAYTYR